MEKDIKILEDFIKYYEAEAISRKFRGSLSIVVDENDVQAIENLIKGYRELEGNKITRERVNDIQEETKRIVDKNYIPKSKIKEKKENEHQKCVDRFMYGNNETPSESYKYKYTEIDMNEYAGMEINRVLNELMEDK